jgi:hypothetical protein
LYTVSKVRRHIEIPRGALLEALESAYQRRDLYLPALKRLPFFDRCRAAPRYRDLLTRMNLA